MAKLILRWDEGFSVGIPSFDDQHKKLFEIVNRVFMALVSKNDPASRELLNGALNEMVEYMKLHFEAEEEAMRAHGYPDYATHKNEHDVFADSVMDFKRRHDKGDAVMTVELLASLVKWLDTHLNGTDKRYTAHLSARGVR